MDNLRICIGEMLQDDKGNIFIVRSFYYQYKDEVVKNDSEGVPALVSLFEFPRRVRYWIPFDIVMDRIKSKKLTFYMENEIEVIPNLFAKINQQTILP
jgi:hypothetical protein